MTKLRIKPFHPTFSLCRQLSLFTIGTIGLAISLHSSIALGQEVQELNAQRININKASEERIDINPDTVNSVEKNTSQTPEQSEEAVDTTPLTRAEFMARLMQLLEQDKNRISGFPTYRDVPMNSEYYADIEIARERGMLPQTREFTPNGFFSPNKNITKREALEIIERTLSGKQPTVETSKLILDPLVDTRLISDDLKPIIAKLLYIRLLRSERLQPIENIDQYLESPFTQDEWQQISERLLAIRQQRYILLPKEEAELTPLEGGLTLKILPAKALFKERIGVGDDVYFTVSEDTALLPRGSSIHGKINKKTEEDHFSILFNQVKTPTDFYYKTRATLDLSFEGNEEGFIIPTEPWIITTETVETKEVIEADVEILPKDFNAPIENQLKEDSAD